MKIALETFDIDRWCRANGFAPSGRFGREFLYDCPFCGAEDKLSVNAERRKWRCFKCQHRFTLTDLVAAIEGSYQRAIEVILTGQAHRSSSLAFIPEDDIARQLSERAPDWEPEPIDPPRGFEPLWAHDEYTARRGFPLEHLHALGVGICNEGIYQDRLVFPVRRPDGAWLYFQSRATWEAHEQDDGRKYRKNLNPPADDIERKASAGDVLLGLELVTGPRVALVEGPTDWLMVGPGAVASFGKSLSNRQITLLARAGVREIDLMWDPDSWVPAVDPYTGQPKPAPAEAAALRLSGIFQLRIVDFPAGTDPGNYAPNQNAWWRQHARDWSAGGRLAFIP